MNACGEQCERRHLGKALEMANARADRWRKRRDEIAAERDALLEELEALRGTD